MNGVSTIKGRQPADIFTSCKYKFELNSEMALLTYIYIYFILFYLHGPPLHTPL
jgi:hypothetical protein